jgi:hypothetical protein
VQPGDKKVPSPSGPIAIVLAACGKARKTIQAPLADDLPAAPVPAVRLPTGIAIASSEPEAARAVHEVVVKYRGRLPEIIQQAGLPHDLPSWAVPHRRCRAVAEDYGEPGRAGRGTGAKFRSRG